MQQDKSSDDASNNSAENAVDRASSKTPLDDDAHIDPSKVRKELEQDRAADKATSKSDGGSAPIKAKPNRPGEADDRAKEPLPENLRSESAHEEVKDELSKEEERPDGTHTKARRDNDRSPRNT